MHRRRLPQLDGGVFLTDGGIETTLIFHHGLELPLFAAFDLLKDDEGTEALRAYYRPYAELAREHGVGLVLEAPTWRASPGWAAQLGYSPEELDGFNRKAIGLMEELRDEYADVRPRRSASPAPRRRRASRARSRSRSRPTAGQALGDAFGEVDDAPAHPRLPTT